MRKKANYLLGPFFLVIIFLFAFEYSYSQSSNCDDYLIYNKVFQKLQQNNKDTLVVTVGNTPNRYTLEDLKLANFLTLKEIKKIELASKSTFEPCEDLKILLGNIKIESPIGKDNGAYTKRYYSRPYYVSKTKAVLFLSFSSKNKKYEGGKKIGSDIVVVYEKVGKNWHFNEHKMLSIF